MKYNIKNEEGGYLASYPVGKRKLLFEIKKKKFKN